MAPQWNRRPTRALSTLCTPEKAGLESLWRSYFRDPSQWWDNRSSKDGPRSPDFKLKGTTEALWMDFRYNPSWVHQELRNRGLVMSKEMKGGTLCVGIRDGDHPNVQEEGINLVALLMACAKQKDLHKGTKLHAEVLKSGLLERNRYVAGTLVNMYAKCGALAKARQVLEELPVRDVVSWNSLIAGYAQQGQGEEALMCFDRMQREGHRPTAVTFTCIVKACGSIGAVDKGKQIHEEIARLGLLKNNIVLGSALVDMYVKCGALAKARHVLDKLPVRNVVSWSALIAGYAQQGQGEEALSCFERMQHEGLSPNAVTFSCVLNACASIGAGNKGQEIHDAIAKQGLLEKNIVLATALVDMYAKCGALAKARKVLAELPFRDVISWNALIAGYAQQGQGHEALSCLEQMEREGLSPDAMTFSCILKACASLGAADKGKEIHDEVVRQGWLGKDIVLGSALVDMYAKCGALAKAQKLLDELPVRSVVSWSALIGGYAQQGKAEEALHCFDRMQEEGICPDAGTLVCVLNACSHSGLLDEGQLYFDQMSSKHGIVPDLEHYVCMIDLFGRAGEFNKALAVIERMPSCDSHAVWHALLGACRKWGNVKVGRLAFERAIQVDKNDAAAYVCMANIYAVAGMQQEADKIENMRVRNKAWKNPGYSWWIDASGKIHSFLVGETKHAQSNRISAKLQDIAQKMSQEGFSPSLHLVSQHISNDVKGDVLCGHSEKLAIACALINTPEGAPVHVVKNMRVCVDCHIATSVISRIEKRKIVVRDATRFHTFEDGKCSCGDYW